MKAGVLKAGYPADIALEVMGYTAAKIYAGKVVGNDIMRAVPYGYDPASGLGFKVVVVPRPRRAAPRPPGVLGVHDRGHLGPLPPAFGPDVRL